MIIPILVATVASLGLGLILSDLLRVPSFAVSKSTHNLGKRQNKKTNPIEPWLKEIAGTLDGKLKINEYKRLQLEADLRTADIPMSPEQYTIRYDANGGTGAPANQSKTYGVPLTLSAVKPTRAGYEFLGWSTDPMTMLTNYAPGERYTDEASITLYAVWRYVPKTYTVSYDANGGGNTPASQTKTEDVTLILTSTIPTRYGYTFKG